MKNTSIETAGNCILITKAEMNALDVINLIEALENKTEELFGILHKSLPQWSECEDCCYCEDLGDDFFIPDWAKLEAGLSPDTKLAICTDKENEVITLAPIGHDYDISDVSGEMQNRLRGMGICLGELNESIIREEVVYSD